MALTFDQTIELLGLTPYEALNLYALGLFPAGERLACRLVFPIVTIKKFISDVRQKGELAENIEWVIGRPLGV